MTSLTGRDLAGARDVMEVALRPAEFASTVSWRRALLNAAKPLLGADRGGFMDIHASGSSWVSDFPMPRVADYDRQLVALLPDRDAWAHQAALGVHLRDEVWLPVRPDFYETGYYRDFLRPIRALDAMGMTWYRRRHDPDAGLYQFLVHHDTDGGPRFGPREKALLELMGPAIRAGAEHAELLPGLLRSGVDAVGAACLLLDSGGRLLHRNPAAVELLEEMADGGTDLLEACSHLAAEDRLPEGAGATVRRVLRAKERVVSISATRLPLDGGLAGWLVTLESPGTQVPLDALAETARSRGLTPRQAEVAALMARRLTHREIADRLGISPHTARRHEEAVLLKLSLGRRSAVLGALTQLPEPRQQ